MPRPSPFESRRPTSRTLSNKANTTRTRNYERSLTGLRAAHFKTDRAAAVSRTRAKQKLSQDRDWKNLSPGEQQAALTAAESKINLRYDQRKRQLTELWNMQERQLQLKEIAPNSESSDQSQFQEGTRVDDNMNFKEQEKVNAISAVMKVGSRKLTTLLDALERQGSIDEESYSEEEYDEEEDDSDTWSISQAEEDLDADEAMSEDE